MIKRESESAGVISWFEIVYQIKHKNICNFIKIRIEIHGVVINVRNINFLTHSQRYRGYIESETSRGVSWEPKSSHKLVNAGHGLQSKGDWLFLW